MVINVHLSLLKVQLFVNCLLKNLDIMVEILVMKLAFLLSSDSKREVRWEGILYINMNFIYIRHYKASAIILSLSLVLPQFKNVNNENFEQSIFYR